MRAKRWKLVLILALTLGVIAAQAPEDLTQLPIVLAWLVSAPGAGAAGYFIMRYYPATWWPNFSRMAKDGVRNWAFLVAGGIGVGVQLLRIQIGYIPPPLGFVPWAEALFSVFMAASGVSTFLHGLFELRGQPRLA